MQNPFRSEEAAFRFLLLTLGAFALIAVAALIETWLGVATWIVLTVGAVGWYLRGRSEPPAQQHVAHVGPPDVRRVLVVANETVESDELLDAVRERCQGVKADVLVVAPALNSRLKHWTSDEDGARGEAGERLGRSLARLEAAGVNARGEVGDDDPLQAIEDALHTFGADEIVVATHPVGRSNWLERGVVAGARERFDVPVTHVIVE